MASDGILWCLTRAFHPARCFTVIPSAGTSLKSSACLRRRYSASGNVRRHRSTGGPPVSQLRPVYPPSSTRIVNILKIIWQRRSLSRLQARCFSRVCWFTANLGNDSTSVDVYFRDNVSHPSFMTLDSTNYLDYTVMFCNDIRFSLIRSCSISLVIIVQFSSTHSSDWLAARDTHHWKRCDILRSRFLTWGRLCVTWDSGKKRKSR